MHPVICFGEALIDMLSSRLQGTEPEAQEIFIRQAGGAPANVAVAVARLGGKSIFLGGLAKDLFGEFLLNELNRYGVDTRYVQYTAEAATALAFVSLDETGERRFSFYRENTADLQFDMNRFDPEVFSHPGIFHLCSNTLTHPSIRTASMQAVALARKEGNLISLDVNLRPALWPPNSQPKKTIQKLVTECHIVKASAEEWAFIADGYGCDGITSYTEYLFTRGVRLIVITDGAGMLRFVTPSFSGEVYPHQVQAVDSTAAGDSFIGALLYQLALLDKPAEMLSDPDRNWLQEALQFASRCGAHTVLHRGAFSALPDLADVADRRC